MIYESHFLWYILFNIYISLKSNFIKCIIVLSVFAFTSSCLYLWNFNFFVLFKCLEFGSVKIPHFIKAPYLKVDINICVAFQCSFITCKCVPEAINSTSTSTCTDIHAYKFLYTATMFSPNFLIIHFCENFINYPKSDCETATYLIELLNNSHIPGMPRIFTYSFPLFLFSKRQAPTLNVALQGHTVQSASSHHAHKWGPAFEMLGTGPNTQPGWNQANFILPFSFPFLRYLECLYMYHFPPFGGMA